MQSNFALGLCGNVKPAAPTVFIPRNAARSMSVSARLTTTKTVCRVVIE